MAAHQARRVSAAHHAVSPETRPARKRRAALPRARAMGSTGQESLRPAEICARLVWVALPSRLPGLAGRAAATGSSAYRQSASMASQNCRSPQSHRGSSGASLSMWTFWGPHMWWCLRSTPARHAPRRSSRVDRSRLTGPPARSARAPDPQPSGPSRPLARPGHAVSGPRRTERPRPAWPRRPLRESTPEPARRPP